MFSSRDENQPSEGGWAVEKLTGSGDKLFVQIVGEERVRERPEIVLHAARDGGQVVELVAVVQVELLLRLEVLRDEFRLTHAARLAVDPFVRHAERLDRLDAFRHDERNFSTFGFRLNDLNHPRVPSQREFGKRCTIIIGEESLRDLHQRLEVRLA